MKAISPQGYYPHNLAKNLVAKCFVLLAGAIFLSSLKVVCGEDVLRAEDISGQTSQEYFVRNTSVSHVNVRDCVMFF